MKRAALWATVALAAAVVAGMFSVTAGEAPRGLASPMDLAFSPDGATLAVSDRTAGRLCLIDVAAKKVVREVPLNGQPTGLAWSSDGKRVYVAERNAGTVAEVDAAGGKVARRLGVGLRPMGVALAEKKGLLVACNTATDDVWIVDLASGQQKARVPLLHQPFEVAVTPDESLAVVGNLLPRGSAADPQTAASISLVDLASLKCVGHIKLPGGSTGLREIAISPDGRWAYAVHTVGRTTLPTTQLERGWVNTNAMSVIDLGAKALAATLLLDRLSEGAADPWGVALAKDGRTVWITLSGVHQVARVDLAGLHLLLDGKPLPKDKGGPGGYIPDIWNEIKKDPKRRADLVNDLAALYGAGLMKRTPIQGHGPRGADLSPDGKTLAVAVYFTGDVAFVEPDTGKVVDRVSLGNQAEADQLRLGERHFHDGTKCFQHWLSCATCHPEEARADGLNWDLLNDGLGNPKNARSLVLSDQTPPVMSQAVRPTMEAAVEAGFRHIQFHQPTEDELRAVEAYLRAVEPEPSPHLKPDKGLTEAAERGKKLFEGKAVCAGCHPPPFYTDLKSYNVGTRYDLDRQDTFDTPTLVEVYRTAPYLHSGMAVTLKDVLTTFNKGDQHGHTSGLSEQEIDDLVQFLLSL
ncbi:MAG: beta-propeller fold lactonase family protein [Planctomycetes bacterium]|nr:beta-propeller fold lactonase family protein [Planctomycetota bacterium]